MKIRLEKNYYYCLNYLIKLMFLINLIFDKLINVFICSYNFLILN